MIVGLAAVLVGEALGFEVGLLHLDALAHDELVQIPLPLLRPLLQQRAILLCVLSPPLWWRLLCTAKPSPLHAPDHKKMQHAVFAIIA